MRYRSIFAATLGAGVLMMVTACGGGGGGGTSSDPSGPSSGGTANAATFAGTYGFTAANGIPGAIAINTSATVTACTVGTASSCAGEITLSANSAGFKLTGNGSQVASGTIDTQGAVSGTYSAPGAPSETLSGTRAGTTFAQCPEGYAANGTQCTPPANARALFAPTLMWNVALPPGGRTYQMELCWDGPTNCESVGKPIFVSNDDLNDSDFPAILAYAESVAKEFGAMISRLWAAKTYPSSDTLKTVLGNAIDLAVATETPNAVETAGAGFNQAGFPAATGGSGGTVSATPPETPVPLPPTEVIGYLQIATPAKHRSFVKDSCTSWQVIGAPVKFSTCSYESGGSGYIVVENNNSPATTNICWTTYLNNGTPEKGCYTNMPRDAIMSASCSSCGAKNGGARSIALTRFGDKRYP